MMRSAWNGKYTKKTIRRKSYRMFFSWQREQKPQKQYFPKSLSHVIEAFFFDQKLVQRCPQMAIFVHIFKY